MPFTFGAISSHDVVDMDKLSPLYVDKKNAFGVRGVLEFSKTTGESFSQDPVVTVTSSSSSSPTPTTPTTSTLQVIQDSYDLTNLPHWPDVVDQGSYGTCVNVTLASVLQFMSKGPKVSSMYGHYNTNARLLGVSPYNIQSSSKSNIYIKQYVADDVSNNISLRPYASGTSSSISYQYNAARGQNYSMMNGTNTIVALSSMDIFGFIDDSRIHYPTILNAESVVIPTLIPNEDDYKIGKQSGRFPYTNLMSIYKGDDLVSSAKYCISVLQVPVIIIWNVCYFSITDAEYNKLPKGHIKNVQPDYILGSHASLLSGYDDSTSEFVLMNSWGQSYGLPEKPGYYKISYDYIKDPTRTTEFWALVPTSTFQNFNIVGEPTSIPAYVEDSINKPLIVGLDNGKNLGGRSFDLIDLTKVFTNGMSFKAVSTCNNASITNGHFMIIYYGFPYLRLNTYQVTVTATNSIGSCTKVFDVHEGEIPSDAPLITAIETDLIAQEKILNDLLLLF